MSIRLSTSYPILAETTTLVSAMTATPSDQRIALINRTITDLKLAGIWDKFDECWGLASHDLQASKLGWKRYCDCTEIGTGSIVLYPGRGLMGSGSRCLNTNFIPSLSGVNYKLNDASFGHYCDNETTSSVMDIGVADITNSTQASLFTYYYGRGVFRINDAGYNLTVINHLGLTVINRPSSTLSQAYYDGAIVSQPSQPSSSLPTLSFYIMGGNYNGSINSQTGRIYSFAFIGGSLNHTQQIQLNNILKYYVNISKGIL